MSLLIDDGHAAHIDRMREFEVDYTPGPVVRQGLEWGLASSWRHRLPGMRFLDPSAGAGVFGQRLGALGHYPSVGMRWAVEPRAEETGNLKRHYDEVESCRFEECDDFDGEPFDVIGTNPPFSLWAMFLERALDLVSDGGMVLFYGALAWGQSSEGARVFSRSMPSACARVVGRVHHRGPGLNPKTGKRWVGDKRDTCWWLWRRGLRQRAWTTENLPALPAEARRWTIRPGTEAP